jgi:metallo-beta-lactamase superfamily protein
MSPPPGGVVVRMYCTGLGDCFLLGFSAGAEGTSYVLIDCGVWKGTAGATEWMQRILGHIRDEVEGHGIELLVVTHQHWDHLSGFGQAKDIFESLEVKQVWMPWTENTEDRTALRLAAERRAAIRAAAAAVHGLRSKLKPEDQDPQAPSAFRTTVENLEAVLKFVGFTPPDDEDAVLEDRALAGLAVSPDPLLGAGPSTDDLLDRVRKKVDKPKYLRPSLKPLALDGAPEVRIYALGPPTDLKYLGKDDPSTGPGKSEVYLAGLLMNEDTALYAAASHPENPDEADDAARERFESACPFDRWQRYPQKTAGADPRYGEFFRSRYLEESERAPAWRRIDTDWLEAASQLALNLDDHINNTSLVLAFELGEGGPVLLFPGDAQVGNWLSWHELKGDGGLTVESLLDRTVLYKVGHHASHNATLKDKGLKMMNRTSRLVAMVPVDEEEAHKPKGRNKNGWAMPYDKLLADLKVRTEGRVVRADKGLVEPAEGEIPDWKGAKVERWDQFRKELVVETATLDVKGKSVTKPFFIQYTVRP